MKVDISSPDFVINESVHQLVEQGLHSIIAWKWRDLRGIQVHIRDFERFGEQVKLCQLTVELRTGQLIRAAASSGSLTTAVQQACESARLAVEDATRRRAGVRRRSLGVLF